MPTASFTNFSAQDFFDLLLPDLPGANPSIVRQELDRVVRDYFCRTYAWMERLVPDDAFAIGQTRIDLNETLQDFASPTKVAQVFEVFENDTPLPRLDMVRRNKRNDVSSLRQWHCPYTSVVEFSGQAWTTAKSLEYLVALYPQERSEQYPQWLWDEHSDAISSGVLGRLMLQMKKPYTNAVDGRRYLNTYKALINSQRAKSDRGGLPNGHAWRYPRTF